MLRLYVRLRSAAVAGLGAVIRPVRRRMADARGLVGEAGQTTAEYALVMLAAAAVAIVLLVWARSTDKLPSFFDQIIDDIVGSTP